MTADPSKCTFYPLVVAFSTNTCNATAQHALGVLMPCSIRQNRPWALVTDEHHLVQQEEADLPTQQTVFSSDF
jgi:hypothetical protein